MKLVDELRRLDLPPTQVADAAWAATARARRRRGIGTAIAAGSAVAAVVLIPALVPDESGGGADDPAPIVSTPQCPDPEPQNYSEIADYPESGVLPRGAGAVRMCALYGTWWDAPPDVLTTDVDALVDEINDQSVQDEFGWCHSHVIDTYALVFAYPDGLAYTAIGSSTGCEDYLHTGEIIRSGADALRHSFLARLVQQRRDQPPPAITPQATCPEIHEAGPTSLVAIDDQTELVDAVVCSYQWALNSGGNGWNNHLTHSAQVQPTVLQELNRATQNDLRPIAADLEMDDHYVAIYAKTAWGDDVTFNLLNGELVLSSPHRLDDPAHPFAITPTPQLTEALRWQR